MSDYKEYVVKVYSDGTKDWFLNGKKNIEKMDLPQSGLMVISDGFSMMNYIEKMGLLLSDQVVLKDGI